MALTVTDYHGFSSVPTIETVSVLSVAPSVTVTGLPSGNVVEGSTIALGSSVTNPSSVLQSAGYSESWEIRFGGTAYGPYYGPALNLTLGSVGAYTVSLTAQDAEGVSSTLTKTIVAADVAPTLTPATTITASPAQQATVTPFNLGAVSGPGLNDGPAYATINWGDGTTSTGFDVESQGSLGQQSHAYQLPGKYTVTVLLTDVHGLTGSESFSTTVTPVPPSPAIIGAPSSMIAGSTVSLGSSITDQSQVETALGFSYSWSVLLNGSSYTLPGNPSTNGPNFSFSPTQSGTYTVNLDTTDSSGSVGVSTPQTIVVTNATPVASFTGLPPTSPAGTLISLTASRERRQLSCQCLRLYIQLDCDGPEYKLEGHWLVLFIHSGVWQHIYGFFDRDERALYTHQQLGDLDCQCYQCGSDVFILRTSDVESSRQRDHFDRIGN